MSDIKRQLDRIEQKIDLILNKEGIIMATIQQLVDDVVKENTLINGVSTLIQGLRDQITAAQGDQSKIDAIFNTMESNIGNLTNALQANTPAAPTTPADPTAPTS